MSTTAAPSSTSTLASSSFSSAFSSSSSSFSSSSMYRTSSSSFTLWPDESSNSLVSFFDLVSGSSVPAPVDNAFESFQRVTGGMDDFLNAPILTEAGLDFQWSQVAAAELDQGVNPAAVEHVEHVALVPEPASEADANSTANADMLADDAMVVPSFSAECFFGLPMDADVSQPLLPYTKPSLRRRTDQAKPYRRLATTVFDNDFETVDFADDDDASDSVPSTPASILSSDQTDEHAASSSSGTSSSRSRRVVKRHRNSSDDSDYEVPSSSSSSSKRASTSSTATRAASYARSSADGRNAASAVVAKPLFSRLTYIPKGGDVSLTPQAETILSDFVAGPLAHESREAHSERLRAETEQLIVEHIRTLGSKLCAEVDNKNRLGDYLSRMKGCLRNAAMGLHLVRNIRPGRLDEESLRAVLECVPPPSARPATKLVDAKMSEALKRVGVVPATRLDLEAYWVNCLHVPDRAFMSRHAHAWPGRWDLLGL